MKRSKEIAVPVTYAHPTTGEPTTYHYYADAEEAAKKVVRLLKAPAKHAKRFGYANLMLMIGDKFENRVCRYVPHLWKTNIAEMWRQAGFSVEQRTATEEEVKTFFTKEKSI